MLLTYDDATHLVDYDLTDDSHVIAQCREERDLALAGAVPLREYTATLDV